MRDMPATELLERVEAAATAGNRRAARLLELLLAEFALASDIGVIGRLAARPHLTHERSLDAANPALLRALGVPVAEPRRVVRSPRRRRVHPGRPQCHIFRSVGEKRASRPAL